MNANDPTSHSAGPDPLSSLDRRRFFQRAGLAWAGAAVGSQILSTAQAQDREIAPIPAKEGEKVVVELPPLEQKEHASGIPRRRFGKTDEWISILGIGGYSIGAQTTPEAEGIAIVQEAVDNGLNFCDNAWEYNKHVSEERMGKALKADGRREKVFLMSKVCTHGRDAKVAMQQLEETLTRLQTDHLDLWQIHECVYWNDPERHFMKGGVVEALTEAKKQGKVRYVGFTGHKDPAIHLAMLAYDYPFDAAQLPLNPFDGTFHSFEQRVLPELRRRGIMPLGMKSLNGNARAQQAHVVSVEEALRYAMSLPVLTTISGMERLPELRQNIEIARNFKPCTHGEMAALRARYLNNVASDGRYELYKTTNSFDAEEGRAQHDFPGQYEKVT